MERDRRARRAFSVIEVLVAVVIMAMVAGAMLGFLRVGKGARSLRSTADGVGWAVSATRARAMQRGEALAIWIDASGRRLVERRLLETDDESGERTLLQLPEGAIARLSATASESEQSPDDALMVAVMLPDGSAGPRGILQVVDMARSEAFEVEIGAVAGRATVRAVELAEKRP